MRLGPRVGLESGIGNRESGSWSEIYFRGYCMYSMSIHLSKHIFIHFTYEQYLVGPGAAARTREPEWDTDRGKARGTD